MHEAALFIIVFSSLAQPLSHLKHVELKQIITREPLGIEQGPVRLKVEPLLEQGHIRMVLVVQVLKHFRVRFHYFRALPHTAVVLR